MQFSHAYLYAPGDGRLVYNVAGGQSERPLPPAKHVPPTAVSAQWNANTLALICTLEDGTLNVISLSEQEIEATKAAEPL